MTSTVSSDPAPKRTDYYPWWLDNIADDVTGEGASIEGTIHGAEDVRRLVLDARALYEDHEFQFTGDYGALHARRGSDSGNRKETTDRPLPPAPRGMTGVKFSG